MGILLRIKEESTKELSSMFGIRNSQQFQKYIVSLGPLPLLIFFGLIYSLISLVNHYLFRTYALDLGLYTQALYDYRVGEFNDSLCFKEEAENLLADHFDLYLPLFSPLSWLLGTYTLLIVQISALLFGALGVYRFFQEESRSIAFWSMFWFLSFYGVFAAVSFDYHSNVVASCVVPWIFLAFKNGKAWRAFFLFSFFLIAKENMALWGFFLAIGWMWINWSNRRLRFLAMVLAAYSLVYFGSITFGVMASLSNSGGYHHFHYTVLGEGPVEALKFLLLNPIEGLRLLFVNHLNEPGFDGFKGELHLFLLASGIWLLFRKPVYLFMLIPIFAQKLFHDNVSMWGIGSQYSIEFAPVLAIGIFTIIQKNATQKGQRILLFLVLAGTVMVTVKSMDNTKMWTNKERIRVYSPIHYSREFNVMRIYTELNLIPPSAAVSAQTSLLPHLALREEVYQFPLIHNATYIVLLPLVDYYPLSQVEWQEQLKAIQHSEQWELISDFPEIVIFRKRADHNSNE